MTLERAPSHGYASDECEQLLKMMGEALFGVVLLVGLTGVYSTQVILQLCLRHDDCINSLHQM